MDYWLKIGKDEIDRALHRYANLRGQSMSESLESTKYPKNVILFIGDGMSLPTVTAARILKGQKYLNVSGEEQYLTWERFPESAFLKVFTYYVLSISFSNLLICRSLNLEYYLIFALIFPQFLKTERKKRGFIGKI